MSLRRGLKESDKKDPADKPTDYDRKNPDVAIAVVSKPATALRELRNEHIIKW